MSPRAPLVAVAVALAACNAVLGAGEPEIVEDEGTSSSASSSAGGGGLGGAPVTSSPAGAGGVADRDDGPGVAAPCGNGELDAGETCDDGNVEEGDGCTATCQISCAAAEVVHPATATCLSLSDKGDRRTRADAELACASRGGALAVLVDPDVAIFEGRLGEPHAVGARRAAGGAFAWDDGTTIDPADVQGDAPGRDCVALPGEDPTTPGPLAAVPCAELLAYVCQRDPAVGL